MRRAITILMVIGLASCIDTKGRAVKGIALGAGMMIVGGVVIATEPRPSDSLNFTDQEFTGGVIMAGGFAFGSVSLLALIFLAIAGDRPFDRSPSHNQPPPPDPGPGPPTEHCGIDGNCVPIGKPNPQ